MIPLSNFVTDQITIIEKIERSLVRERILDKSEIIKLLIKLKSTLYFYRKPFDHTEFSIFVDKIIREYVLDRNEIGEVPDYFKKPKKVLNLDEAINLKTNQILKSEIPFHFNIAFCLLNGNYEKDLRLNHWDNYHSNEDYIYEQRFRFHGDEQKFQKAIDIFSQIIDANDNLYAPYLFRALSNFHLRQNFDQIESDLGRAELLTTKDYVVNNAKAYYCYNFSHEDQAYRILEETIRKWPDYYKTYFNFGILKMEYGNYDESIDLFNKAKRLNSSISADALYLIAIQYLMKNNRKHIDLAIDLLIDARNLDPGHWEAEMLRMQCESAKGLIFTKSVDATKYGYKSLRKGFYNT